jgi:hypothetical protein
MDFLSPWSLAGLALVPAILLWGLLAPRGRQVTVGSLLLWRRAFGSGPAGRPSARMRLRDPLLWLDASAVLFLVLACARPSVPTSAPTEPVATFVFDCTAAMMVTPKGDNTTRSQQVREMVHQILRTTDDVPVEVISVPDFQGEIAVQTISTLLPPTASPYLDRFCTPRLADRDVWPEAVAEAARCPDRPVILVTAIPPQHGEKIPANLYMLAAGGESANAGLMRAAVRIEGDKAWLLVAARSSPAATGSCSLIVMGDGREIARKDSFLPPGGKAEVILPLPSPPPRTIRADLVDAATDRSPADGFSADDSVFLALDVVPQRTILIVGSPDTSLRHALTVLPNTRVVEAAAGEAAPEKVDLVVACGVPLPADWKGPAVVVTPAEAVGPVRPLQGEAPAAWLVPAAHPLAGALYLDAPSIGSVRRYELGTGADLLLGAADVPLAATWQADGAKRLAVLFPLDSKTTNWAQRPGFPVFWLHAVEWLAPVSDGMPGYSMVPPFAAEHGSVEATPGRTERAPAQPGFYNNGRLAVSFIGAEGPFVSGPARDDSASAAEAIRVSVAAHRIASHTDLWPLLAVAAIIVLVARARVGR